MVDSGSLLIFTTTFSFGSHHLTLGATMLDQCFILATSAIYLITVVSVCLLELILAKVTLHSLIHPSMPIGRVAVLRYCHVK